MGEQVPNKLCRRALGVEEVETIRAEVVQRVSQSLDWSNNLGESAGDGRGGRTHRAVLPREGIYVFPLRAALCGAQEVVS